MLHIQLLGPVNAWGDGGLLTTNCRPQERLALAVLADRAEHVVARESFVEGIWGALPPDSALPTLYSHISRLRRRLGPHAGLVRAHGGYLLELRGGTVDSHRFRSLLEQASRTGTSPLDACDLLERALGLWRSVPLGGLNAPWAVRHRDQLLRLRLRALLRWSDAARACGRAEHAVDALAELLDEDPLCEPAAARLMACLHTLGHGAQALRCFARLREDLGHALGHSPGGQAQAVHALVLRDEPVPADLSSLVAQRQPPPRHTL
ncbi:BTAD domain-containing putative transcriptional regulator [Streptomyces sp. NPDC004111]|uniref:AfsR/SARP family transcriptional regulator n=1 Tax=Streptomyces sp. NPDC004111 TaxID=3364690 RepID=UPI00368DF841